MREKKIFFSALLAFVMFFGMICTAVLTNQKEVIFPEAAALCAGALLAPVQPWSVSKPRFVIIMTICSVAGLLLALWSAPLLLREMLGFTFAVVCIKVFRCSLVPAISACVLPVILGTDTILYPISVFALALCTVLFQLILEKASLRKSKKYIKTAIPDKKDILHWLIMFVCVLVYSIYPTTSGNVLFIAPPLIVMFCEILSPERRFYKSEHKICLAVITCAVIGSMSVFACCALNISLLFAAAFVSLAVIVLMNLTKIFFPPAAALAFLPFIINENMLLWYPLFIAFTAVVISAVSAIVSRNILPKKLEETLKA